MRRVLDLVIAVALLVSAVSHGYLYLHGYRSLPGVGAGFIWTASIFAALALLIALGGPAWLRLAALVGAVSALGAFVMSRTVGLLGFTEHGWQPAPHAVLSVCAELVVAGLSVWSVWSVMRWPHPRNPLTRPRRPRVDFRAVGPDDR